MHESHSLFELLVFSTDFHEPPLCASMPAFLRIFTARPDRIPLTQQVMIGFFSFLKLDILDGIESRGTFRDSSPWAALYS